MEFIGEILQGAAQLANTIISPIAQRRQQKRNQKYAQENAKLEGQIQLDNSLKTMEQQQKYNLENYEKQRDDSYAREDYLLANSKKIEQKAYTDSGINPAWAAANGGISAGSSVSAPMMSSPQGGSAPVNVVNPGYSSPFTPLPDLGMAYATIKKLQAETKAIEVDTENKESKNVTFETIGELFGIPIKDAGSFEAANLFNQAASNYFSMKELEETSRMRSTMAKAFNDSPELQEKYKQSLMNQYEQVGEVNKKIMSETGKTLQEILNLKEGVKYTKQQIKESVSRIDKNTQDILIGIMQEAKMDEEIMSMQSQRHLAQNVDYATILKRINDAHDNGDDDEMNYWNNVLMYRSHNYEGLIPAGIYSAGNIISDLIDILGIVKGKKMPKIGFK